MGENCGQMHGMHAGYCVRPPGHHGACLHESGRRFHLTAIKHADDCAGCEAEYAADDERKAQRRAALAGAQ